MITQPINLNYETELSPEDEARLEALYEQLKKTEKVSIGYPCNQKFNYAHLYRFLSFAINNVGDPFSGSNYRMNTHAFEREVVLDFAKFAEIEPQACWGYVTNGGTEGNMYGLYVARELLPDGMVYYSEDTHYSVAKILRLQHTRSIMIRSQAHGEMDYADLEESLSIHRDVPPIVFANAGTTMKGALDNLDRIKAIFEKLCLTHTYIHVDAALSGMILPFVDDPTPWNFASGADSISISGHKLIGSPLPCGVALVKKVLMERISRSVEYVGALDTTISGSRNALTPLILWYALRTNRESGFRTMITHSLSMADYAIDQLARIGIKAWRNPNSITVVFPRPPDAILQEWVLAPFRDICHLITLPSTTTKTIDRFVNDLAQALPET